MKRLSAYIALPLAASLALGCQAELKGFMPLEIGRKIVYEVDYFSMLGDVQHAQAVRRIDEKKNIGGKEYFRVVEVVTGIPGHETEIYYQRWDTDGLHELRYIDGRPVDFLQTPWPLKVGQAWVVNEAGSELTCRVDAQMPAILPEKTYDDAYKISCYGTHLENRSKKEIYLVEGVGEVRIVLEEGPHKMELRLKEVE